jgi:hypothetical protein
MPKPKPPMKRQETIKRQDKVAPGGVAARGAATTDMKTKAPVVSSAGASRDCLGAT